MLITELDRITPKVLNGYNKLRFIGDCRATPANIQVDACTQASVPVLCTPGRNTQAVAELVVGLMVVFLRNAIPAIQWACGSGVLVADKTLTPTAPALRYQVAEFLANFCQKVVPAETGKAA